MNIFKYTRNVSLWLALIFLVSGCARDEEVWRCYDQKKKREKDHLLVTINHLSESVFIEEFYHTFYPVRVGNSTIGYKNLPPEFEITNIDFTDAKITFSPNTIFIASIFSDDVASYYDINLENRTMVSKLYGPRPVHLGNKLGESVWTHVLYRCETKLF